MLIKPLWPILLFPRGPCDLARVPVGDTVGAAAVSGARPVLSLVVMAAEGDFYGLEEERENPALAFCP